MYTDENIFKEKDIADRYEKFLVESLNKVSKEFKGLFQWVNEKILLPNLLWREGSKPSVVRIIDFGIGSGKFTIPHIKTLIDAEVHVQVLGFDNSDYMLEKFKKNAKKELGISFPNGKNEFLNFLTKHKIEKIKICNKDINDHKTILSEIENFLNGKAKKEDDRSEATLVCFAQVWHYLKNPEDFFNAVIIGKLRGSYILHYEPVYYFKLLDGNFDQTDVSLDFSSEKAQLHRRFWMHYFFLRDKIRPYSTQRIKGAEANWCFKRYEESNFINMGHYDKIKWEKDLHLTDLIDIIEDPILSAQYVGLNVNQRKNLANKMKKFDSGNTFSRKNFRFGYIGHLLSTKKLSDSRYPLQISLGEEDKVYEVKERESVSDVLKSMFPDFKFFFFGLTYINRFSFEGFKSIEISNLEPWKEFIEEILKIGIPSVAEIIIKEKDIGDSLVIEDLLNKKRMVTSNKALSKKVQQKINSILGIMCNKALNRIPLIKGVKGKNSQYCNVGAFYFLLFSQDIVESIYLNIIPTIIFGYDGKIEKKILESIIKKTRREWRSVFKEELKEVRQEYMKHSLRSAVVAIMARNMSHNIGSHVLTKTSVYEDDEVKKLHSYLRARMDFLADIPTSSSPILLPAKLYTDIMRVYKPFNEDGQFTQNNKTFTLTQKILLDRISAVEEIKSDKIKFIYKKDGEKLDEINKLIEKDISFACPNGVLGHQAFYGIFENIIRNVAKHANVGEINLTVKIEDSWQLPEEECKKMSEAQKGKKETKNDLIKITISDNAVNCTYDKKEAKKVNSTKKGKIVTIEELNHFISESIIDEERKLRPENWGIKEIKICASYLRGFLPEEIETSQIPPILKAVKVNNKGKVITSNNILGNLGYEFYLLRPKRIFVVDGKFNDRNWAQDELNNLSSKGVDIRPSLKVEEVKRGIKHDFLLLSQPNQEISDKIEKYCYYLPIRVVRDNGDIIDKLKNNEIEEALMILWDGWIKELANGKKPIEDIIKVMTPTNVTVLNVLDPKMVMKNRELCELPQDVQYIIYDYYFWHGASEGATKDQNILKNLNNLRKNNFWEPYRNFHPISPILTYLPKDLNSKKILAYELIEAGLISMTIIDERIQESLENGELEWDNSGPREILNYMGINVPLKSDCDLNFRKTDDLKKRRENIENWVNDNSKQCFVMIIHQGILDRIGLSQPKNAEEWIQKMQNNCKVKHIIVDSGRGVPSNIPPNARFLHLSNLMRYTIEYKSKYHLSKLVFASRTKKEWKNE